MTWKKVLTTLVFFGIGVALFWLAMQGVEDPEALKRDMRSAQWWGIAASFVMGYLAIVSRGWRWNLLLAPMGHHPSRARSVHAVAFSYFANAFVPRSGEVARCAALNQTDDIPVDQLLGTVITERVVDFVMLFGLVAFALVTNLDAFLTLMEAAQLPALPTLVSAGVLGVAMCVLQIIRLERPIAGRNLGVCEISTGLGYMIGPPLGGFLFSAGGFSMPFIVLGTVPPFP